MGGSGLVKEFLEDVNMVIGQLGSVGEPTMEYLQKMKASYGKLDREEQLNSIQILNKILKEDYNYYYLVMSLLLTELRDENIAFCIGEELVQKNCSLWARLCLEVQMNMFMFSSELSYRDEYEEYKMMGNIYKSLQKEINKCLGVKYEYIPYCERNKTVVIIVWQFLSVEHAPTRKAIDIYSYLRKLGYEVKIYVCFLSGEVDKKSIHWYKEMRGNNFCVESTEFAVNMGNSTILGYNAVLEKEKYIFQLRDLMGRIWDEKPEWILELGCRTVLADLCQQFTTVVTMSCTKSAPTTNAPIVARYFNYSKEEDTFFRKCLDKNQKVIDVPHEIGGIDKSGVLYKKCDFGISEDAFVIVIAGNRLDQEITMKFLLILYEILEQNDKFVIAMIGDCKDVKHTVEIGHFSDRFYFLGNQKAFREVISIGDVFLNPPRQGGGTGGLFAILEQVPVVTLDDCDVESICGKEFVCESIIDIPNLIHKYFQDVEFMRKQKEVCKVNAEKFMNVDSLGNFKALCDLVKELTLEKEKMYES